MITRFERMAEHFELFLDAPIDRREGIEDWARQALAIADSRTLWTPAEVCTYIGRFPPIWANWQKRQSHDVPAPAFRTSSGAMYDAEDVQEWASRPECYALLGDGSEARRATWTPTGDGASQLGQRIGRSVVDALAPDPE